MCEGGLLRAFPGHLSIFFYCVGFLFFWVGVVDGVVPCYYTCCDLSDLVFAFGILSVWCYFGVAGFFTWRVTAGYVNQVFDSGVGFFPSDF